VPSSGYLIIKGLSVKIDARQQNGTAASIIKGQWCLSRANWTAHLLPPRAGGGDTLRELTAQQWEYNDVQNNRQV
jgi:hypothetical protein